MEVEHDCKIYHIKRLTGESLSAMNDRNSIFKELLSSKHSYNDALKYSEIHYYTKYLGCKYKHLS